MRKHRPAVVARAVRRASGAPPRPSAAGSSWLLLGVVLVGLFAMHGLSTHGTHALHAAEQVTGSASVPGTSAATAHVEHPADALIHGVVAVSTDAASVVASVHLADLPGAVRAASHLVKRDVPAGSSGVGGLMGLCLAVLTALVAWLVACGRAPRMLARVPGVSQVVAARGPGRDRDPPSLLLLSVHRC
jgi:hypothetical protein